MKKITIALFTILFASCSKNDSPEEIATSQTAAVSPVSFKITPTLGRMGGYANFQAGEIIEYGLNITDEDKTAGITYLVLPEGEDQTKHQVRNSDYILGNKDLTELTLSSNAIGNFVLTQKQLVFKIKIKNPGTFILVFKLQKLINGEKIGEPIIENVLFSAVSFEASTNFGRSSSGNGYECNYHEDRLFYFSVDDGNQTNDNFLTETQSFTYNYVTEYNYSGLGGFSSDLKTSLNIFSPTRSGRCCIDGVRQSIINKITINRKTIVGGFNYPITYYNIPVTQEYDNL